MPRVKFVAHSTQEPKGLTPENYSRKQALAESRFWRLFNKVAKQVGIKVEPKRFWWNDLPVHLDFVADKEEMHACKKAFEKASKGRIEIGVYECYDSKGNFMPDASSALKPSK